MEYLILLPAKQQWKLTLYINYVLISKLHNYKINQIN